MTEKSGLAEVSTFLSLCLQSCWFRYYPSQLVGVSLPLLRIHLQMVFDRKETFGETRVCFEKSVPKRSRGSFEDMD